MKIGLELEPGEGPRRIGSLVVHKYLLQAQQ